MAGAGAPVKRGLFIVLEGPDGAGISTQTALLHSGLVQRDMKAIATKEPTNGPYRLDYPAGPHAQAGISPDRQVGDDVMALLYAADRLDHIRADVVPRLEAGITVVCDRYRLSSYAYQGLNLGQEWVRALNKRSIAPDVTFFIDVPPDVSQQRIKARGGYIEMYETEERLAPIYANYLELIEQDRQSGDHIITIDGRLAIGVVADTILQKTLEIIDVKRET